MNIDLLLTNLTKAAFKCQCKFHRWEPGILRIPSSSHTVYSLVRAHGVGPCVGSAILAYAMPREQASFGIISTRSIRNFAILPSPYLMHRATTRRQDQQNIQLVSFWDGRSPKVHDIKVKQKGKAAYWEGFRTILTLHRDRHNRARRVWATFSECGPTKEELAVKWPQDRKVCTRRKLQDKEEDQYCYGSRDFFTVTEIVDGKGRRFWREFIKLGEFNDEEEELSWEEMMREEDFFDEIERPMAKAR